MIVSLHGKAAGNSMSTHSKLKILKKKVIHSIILRLLKNNFHYYPKMSIGLPFWRATNNFHVPYSQLNLFHLKQYKGVGRLSLLDGWLYQREVDLFPKGSQFSCSFPFGLKHILL